MTENIMRKIVSREHTMTNSHEYVILHLECGHTRTLRNMRNVLKVSGESADGSTACCWGCCKEAEDPTPSEIARAKYQYNTFGPKAIIGAMALAITLALALAGTQSYANAKGSRKDSASTPIRQITIALTPDIAHYIPEDGDVQSGTSGGEIHNWVVDYKGKRIGELTVKFE